MLLKKLIFLLVVQLLVVGVIGQSKAYETLISKGQAAYEVGSNEEALQFFKQAFLMKRKSGEAIYHMAQAYLALNDYQNAISFSGRLMNPKNKYCLDAYLVNGSAWQGLGRKEKAIKMYRKGLKLFPSSYLLHYNLSYVLFKNKMLDEAQVHVIRSIELQNNNGSSHLLLSYIMNRKGERVKSILPLYYFFLIEPQGERSEATYNYLQQILNQGVSLNTQKNIRLVQSGYNYKDFGNVELALSKLDKSIKPGGNLSDFVSFNKELFKNLVKENKNDKDFWLGFYVKKIKKIEEQKLVAPFSYFISSIKYKNEVKKWISENQNEFERFVKWINVL